MFYLSKLTGMHLPKVIFRIPAYCSLSLLNASSVAILALLLCGAAAIAQPGTPVWTNRYNELGVGEADAYEMAVDRNGNVFVTGESGGDYATIAYSNAGVPLWTNRYGAPENGYDTPYGVVVDSGGTVFVTGWSANRYATIAYSNAGVPLWTNLYSRPGNGSDSAHAIVVDTGGTVFVTGLSDGENVTIAYSNAGVPLWTNFYNEPDQIGARACSRRALFAGGLPAGGRRHPQAGVEGLALAVVA
jgi:streptogramin lyase